jgi:putative acyl-CoA dehydrogenase
MAEVETLLADGNHVETRARRIVERLALALQAAMLIRSAPPPVAEAFCAARLGGDAGLAFGTLPAGVAVRDIVERHTPLTSAA